MLTGGPCAVHFPRPPAEGPAGGLGIPHNSCFDAGGGAGRGGGGGGGGPGVSGRPRHPSAPRSRRHTPRELGPGACPSSSSLAAAAKPRAGGSAVHTMSVALSNRFQGRRRCSPAPAVPRPCPVPRLASRAPWPVPDVSRPPPVRTGRSAGSAARGSGRGRAHAARGDPSFPGRLFVSSRRESVRLAQSPAREEAGRDQQGKRAPPPSLSNSAAAQGSLPGAPKAPSARRVPPLSAFACGELSRSSSPRASPNFLPPALCLQVGPPPLPPSPSGLGLQVVTLRPGR